MNRGNDANLRQASDRPLSTPSASTVSLNIHATEFVPKHEAVFRHEYPSLTTSKLRRPKKPTTTTTTPLTFHTVVATPTRAPLLPPSPPPSVPAGFVLLSKVSKPSLVHANTVVEVEPPQQTLTTAPYQLVPVQSTTRRRHTKTRVSEWRAPPSQPPLPSSPSTTQDDFADLSPLSQPALTRKDAQGRSPGYFFHVAAQSKVHGRQIDYDDEVGDNAANRCHRITAPRPQASTAVALEVPSAHSQLREAWRTMAARILTSAHLTLEDFTALSTYLTTHRALLLWDERDDDRRNAWHVAAAHGHDSVLTLLHGLGDGLDARDRKKLTPLHAAAANGHPSTVRLLLSLGASPAAVDKHGNTPFHVACREGHVAVVKVLLPKSKVDGRNRRRDTPLLLAVRSAASKPPPSSQSKASVEWMDVVRLLLVAGASPLVANHDGHTPLYESLLSPGLALAQKLLVYGYPTAANTSQSASSTTALLSVLYQAVCTGHVDAVELLVPYLPPSEWLVVDKVFGDSLLHAAVRHVRVTNALLRALIQSSQHGKALHAAENKALQTPLFLAIHLGNADAVARLLAHGGVPNERNRRLHSALYVAVRTHQIPCVRELIAAGCSLDADCIAFVKAHTPMALPPLVAAPSTWLPATTTSDMQTVVCTVDGQVDAVHIALLVGHCPSLRARLCGPWAAATSTSSLAIDATRSTWTLVKAYLYNGGCSNLLSNVEENGEELVELLVLANSLLLFDLQRLCLATLQQALTPRDFRELETHLGTLACRDSDCDDVAARVIDTWRHDRRQLLTNQWLANVALIAEGGGSQPSNVHTCHRAVVSAASPVLRAHFNSNHTEYSLPFTTKVVDFVLEFMYTETLAELADLPVDMLVDIAQASVALDLAGCVALCERTLVHRVMQSGCDVGLLSVADALGLSHVAAACRLSLLGSLPTDKSVLLSCFAGRIRENTESNPLCFLV